MAQPALSVQDLHKSFGAVKAVQGVSFEVQTGEVFSLLGPNGAGKTTVISMLCGLLVPDSGELEFAGIIPGKTVGPAARARIGLVPQDVALYSDMSAQENLFFWGRMYGLSGERLAGRVQAVLKAVGLTERQQDRVSTYSGGMKRRINIAAALLHEPAIVIMDEPTVGIDPQSRRHILDHVKGLNRAGTTVLYTTHYMEEAQELSHRIAIMDYGKVIACGTHEELVKLVGEQTRVDLVFSGEPKDVIAAWQGIEGVSRVTAETGTAVVLVTDPDTVVPRLFEAAAGTECRILALEIREPNLEAVFLQLTGRALRD